MCTSGPRALDLRLRRCAGRMGCCSPSASSPAWGRGGRGLWICPMKNRASKLLLWQLWPIYKTVNAKELNFTYIFGFLYLIEVPSSDLPNRRAVFASSWKESDYFCVSPKNQIMCYSPTKYILSKTIVLPYFFVFEQFLSLFNGAQHECERVFRVEIARSEIGWAEG